MEDKITLIDTALKELNTAIQHHYEWLNMLLLSAAFHKTFPPELTCSSSHLSCHFSHWLVHWRRKIAVNNFQEIECRHKCMHDEMRKIVFALEHKKASETLLNAFCVCQQQFIKEIDKYKEQLLSLRNMHDSLTSLPLRGLLYNEFDNFVAHCDLEHTQCYLLMMDVDNFKYVNDTFGHNFGDEVLKTLATVFRRSMRTVDNTYRFGGEEFIALTNVKNVRAALLVANRICHAVRTTPITLPDGTLFYVTITIGMVRCQQALPLQTAIERADNAMYQGKNNGRDQVVLHHDTETSPYDACPS